MTAGNGQYEIKESFHHLEISCRYIAEKFGASNFSEWTNGDYIRLSSILSRTTSVQISPNTLKRIFGKLKTPERYYPQRATRDALVQYVGYKDWDSFLRAHPKPAKPAVIVPENPAGTPSEKAGGTPSEKAGGTTREQSTGAMPGQSAGMDPEKAAGTTSGQSYGTATDRPEDSRPENSDDRTTENIADRVPKKPVDLTSERHGDISAEKLVDPGSSAEANPYANGAPRPRHSSREESDPLREAALRNDPANSNIETGTRLQPSKADVATVVRESLTAAKESRIQETSAKKTSTRLYYLLAGIIIILISGYFVSKQITAKQVVDLHQGINFSCKNPIGKNPHSAVFKLQLTDQFRGDESQFTIVFGDGRAEKKIRNGIVQTHYYEIPGRYYARLLYNGNPVDTIPVFLQTDGWTATATVERDTLRVYPVNADSLFAAGYLSASSGALKHAGVDTNKTFYVDFVNTHTTNIDGDNFRFSCDINTSLERAGVRCSQLMLIIYGEKSFHKVFMMKPGCEAWCNLTFSDFYRDGKEDDLNFLAADLSAGGKLGLTVKNKQVSLVLNNNEIYTAGYGLPMGKIYGVKISFSGVGKIHDVQLSDTGSGQPNNEAGLK